MLFHYWMFYKFCGDSQNPLWTAIMFLILFNSNCICKPSIIFLSRYFRGHVHSNSEYNLTKVTKHVPHLLLNRGDFASPSPIIGYVYFAPPPYYWIGSVFLLFLNVKKNLKKRYS